MITIQDMSEKKEGKPADGEDVQLIKKKTATTFSKVAEASTESLGLLEDFIQSTPIIAPKPVEKEKRERKLNKLVIRGDWSREGKSHRVKRLKKQKFGGQDEEECWPVFPLNPDQNPPKKMKEEFDLWLSIGFVKRPKYFFKPLSSSFEY